MPSAASAEFRYVAPSAARAGVTVLDELGDRGERNGATLAQTLKRLAPPSLRLRYDRRVDAAKAVMDEYPDWQSLLFGEGLAAVRRGGELHIRPAGLPPGAVELAAADRGHGVWRVEAGDTLRAVLERWGTRAGVEVLFLTDRRYRLHRGQAFEGAFIDAVRALFFALSHLPHPPAGEFTAGGRSLAVTHRAPQIPQTEANHELGTDRKLRQNITTIMAAVSVAVVAIPAARAAEPDLVSALRDKGAQIMPLGARGGLAGYLVTPVGGAGYSLYVTGDGHGVAGLLYGPDGVLITGGQLAAVRGENRPAGTAPNPLQILAPRGAAPVAPVSREAGPPGCGVTGIAPPEGASTMNAHGAGARDPVVPLEVATRDTANRVSRAVLFERRRPHSALPSGSADRWSSCSAIRVVHGRARPSRGSAARRWPESRLHVVPVARARLRAPGGGDRRQFRSGASLVRRRSGWPGRPGPHHAQ